ncbi:MAG: 1,4-alpha-glucan branching protein GlgB [Pseudomonadales bacterium]|jgi:1,4-alpha-glucan branching enzyme|nr:1,4-alpha-glucan branching protein GlgB [Pseudomonadales bacterium]
MTSSKISPPARPQPAPGPDKYALIPAEAVNLLIKGRYANVFEWLGMHAHPSGARQVSVFLPGALAVELVNSTGKRSLESLQMIHEEGLFSGLLGRKRQVPYRLKVRYPHAEVVVDDPYRFPALLDATDLYLFSNGTQEQAWRFMGANHRVVDDVAGVLFAVWAPNAKRVSLVSAANHWDGRVHVMRQHPGAGVWEIFIPGMAAGTPYKFEILTPDDRLLPLKADPYARLMELRPGTAARVPAPDSYEWQDRAWMEQRRGQSHHAQPLCIYEVHASSWKRHAHADSDGERAALSYRELADDLLTYVQWLGFTHVQLLPVSEFPFDGSWGYQPLGFYAPTSRLGTPDDFRYFVDRAHQLGLGVLLDWVPGHFPSDSHGLALFDGTHLYEHADPRKGFHPDWNTCIYNYGRAEVRSYLLSNALYWLSEFHLDGLRFDAVASMLYLDYSRQHGEWIPNHSGGRENFEAIELLRDINARAYFNFPGVLMVAEESTAWPGVTRFIESGGLGFGFKWNMGWMNDTLRYLARDPVHRKFHHNEMTFSLLYSFSENFILPLSHDEVVHGKRSILERVPGNDADKFATLRAYYLFMWTHPGKKLLFMGNEFAQRDEWRHEHSLDWHLLQYAPHQGVQHLVRDLNQLYRQQSALYELDSSGEGFEWIEANAYEHSWFCYRRKGRVTGDEVVVLLNFTPTPHLGLRVGVPEGGWYYERLNTDAQEYGGSGAGNLGGLHAEPIPAHGLPWSLLVRLPGLAGLVFSRS